MTKSQLKMINVAEAQAKGFRGEAQKFLGEARALAAQADQVFSEALTILAEETGVKLEPDTVVNFTRDEKTKQITEVTFGKKDEKANGPAA